MYFEPKMSQLHMNVDFPRIKQNLQQLENIEWWFDVGLLIVFGFIVLHAL